MLVLLCIGCKPLYGEKAQPLRTPEPVKPPDDPVVVNKVEYKEDCAFFTTRPTGKIKRDSAKAEEHTLEADKKHDQELEDAGG